MFTEKDVRSIDLALRAIKRAKFESLDGEEVTHLGEAFSHLFDLGKRAKEYLNAEAKRKADEEKAAKEAAKEAEEMADELEDEEFEDEEPAPEPKRKLRRINGRKLERK